MSGIESYVRFWDRREGPESLALVRIAVGCVLLFDLWQVAHFDLVHALWAPIEEGGIGPSSLAKPLGLFGFWLEPSAQNATRIFGLCFVTACTLSLGLCTRSSALLLMLGSAQLSALAPASDRGVDSLLRQVLCLLALSHAGATWSIDALLRRHTPRVTAVPAWPRYLLVLQITLMYFAAGVLKQTAEWTSLGGYSAIARVLSHPHVSRFEWSTSQLAAVHPLLQLAAIGTLTFERSAIFVPLVMWLRANPVRGGAVGRWLRRHPVLEIWAATGVFFHLSLAAFVKLGIFPWACIALYPALLSPERIRVRWSRASARWRFLLSRVAE